MHLYSRPKKTNTYPMQPNFMDPKAILRHIQPDNPVSLLPKNAILLALSTR